MMKRKITSLILALAMLLSMMPAASLSVFAEGEHSLTVDQSANTAFETKQGVLLEIPLTEYFTDSEGHALTYTLETTGLGPHTKVQGNTLYFTESTVKTYSVEVQAACTDGASASVTFAVTVTEAAAGSDSQYNYDETPANEVTVYVTVSNDGVPLQGCDGTVLSHLEVKLPYFDLRNHDLSEFYRYHTENGRGDYVDTNIVERPTALHLYLYLIGKYYLGLTDKQITQGSGKIDGAEGNRGVFYFDGREAVPYEDKGLALNVTGSATHMYMKAFWGHDENLMYYRNHVYPYMSAGTGSTADYVLLSDGDTIDVAMFTDWDFWHDGGAFACFDEDSYTVQKGETLTFKTQKFGTQGVADGGTDDFVPITGLDVAVYSVGEDGTWKKVAEVPAAETGKNGYSYSFDQEGTYYLLAMDPNGASKNARVAPATAKVVVEEQTVVIPVTGVTLDKTELALTVGGEETLTATVAPANATNKTVTWTSSNDQVAAVDNGKVTAVGAGEATITVTTADGGFKATCTVTVTANEPAVPTQDADGTYLIRTGAQLKWFADYVNQGGDNAKANAKLEKDVDLSGICSEELGSWTPIGGAGLGQEFLGNFDGQNHKVTGLYIKREGSAGNGDTYYSGLFGQCSGATIKNLSVYGEACAVTRYVAGIVGRMTNLAKNPNGARIENCHNYVEIKSDDASADIYGFAGIVASAQDVTIRDCSNHAAISGVKGSTAGILGNVSYGSVTIERCYNTGAIKMLEHNYNYGGVGGILGTIESGTTTIANCYNTGSVTEESAKACGAKVAGIAAYLKNGTLELKNCYNTGLIGGTVNAAGRANGIFGKNYSAQKPVLTVTDSYYLTGSAPADKKTNGIPVDTPAELSEKILESAGEAYIDSCPTPVLKGQTAVEHSAPDAAGCCTVCKKELVKTPVPTRKADYPAESQAVVQTGKAYLLSDLQTGKVFDPVEGQKLTYQNYYYQRSADGGKTWGPMTGFAEAMGTTIQLTETKEGTYVYRFFASHDGVHFSKDTWTLTLTVMDHPPMDFTFFVGKDYTGGYPVIKLYPVTADSEGNETLGAELTVTQGEIEENYQKFSANLIAGRYAYRAFAKNAETGAYDVALGGMTLDLPADTNVDGGTGGGNSVYLQCNSFCVSSKKTDGTYFTADEYHVEVVCPIMKTSCVMGDAYVKGNYTYYPTVLYAAGNACLYNLYAYPDIEGYMFTQTINQTFRAGYSANTKSLTINTEVGLTVTVPENADFGLYFQWNNFNTTKVEPLGSWTVNGDGTKTAFYKISKGNGNYTWRMSDSAHVTQAGWLASQSKDASETFAFAADAATDRVSHDFSQLGSQTALRDEADLQVNLDPTGYKALTGTTRVRAYRHWQLINSDAGNIMVEPDFHWNVLSGNASFETVDGGNTTANWADVTPGTEDSILTVYYDSVDVNHGSYGTHGGLYPATQPNRLGVIVVGGSGVTHGTADAHVKYNMAPGATTTRSAEWDYNYDTWFYEASETAPALTFTVTRTGDTTVEYAFVTANADMTAVKTDFTAASAENGTYTVPLAGFRALGAGKGGTVVLKMTDSTGVSYRLVRAAEVTITAENASNLGEVIMPGDQVKLTWTGMYRAVNKISGIFNPLQFKPTYYQGETKYEGALGQYQKMNNASVTVAIPKDVTFAEGEDSVKLTFTGGYTFGTMFAAANPFAFLYSMTDTGVGTNFNAVTVNYYMNHYADAVVTVSRKVLYDTALRVTDESGAALEGAAVVLTGPEGDVEAGANGRYSLGYGKYSYVLRKDGYVVTRGSFTLGSADADKLVEGVLTISASMAKAGENAWDGTTLTEPTKDTDGAWLIGTAAELAWFAKNGGQGSAKLTADIELAGYDWTPMAKLYGAFDGQGHVIRNLYINSSSYPVGLFGYLQSGASVTRLGVTGSVTCTAKSSAQAGGVAGYMNDNSSITQCFSAVHVTSNKHGGGIAGYTSTGAVISDCYATGNIVSTAANECYLGGICGSYYKQSAGAKLTNCYFSGTVKGSGGNASYVGGLSPVSGGSYFGNSYYREGCVSGESAKYGVTGLGTAKTAEELKALAPTLGGWFTADVGGINGGYPILKWQIGLSYIPVESVTLDQTELELIVGKEATLTAAAAPADASDQTVTWTSSAPEIATVENGKITALAEGTAIITVTTVDGGKTAQCQVTVKPIPTYSVTLPADFTGESTVQDGADYTFTAKDPAKYIYTVTAVMGGQTVEVIDNGDGTYTVKNVTGDLVIEATKVRRSEPITPVGPAKPDKPAEPEQPEKPELTAHAAFVTGYADGTVRPLNNITRSEVAAMLCRLLTESQKQNVPQAGKTFSDVPADAWYRENVSILAGMGVITGRADGTFAPAQNITRAEFAVMLTRFAGTTGEQGGEETFSDISGHWAESAIRAAAARGWVKGMSDGTFRPDASITRAEAMAMLCRMLGCEPASAAELPENMPAFSDNADTGAWYYLYVQEAACARNGK